MTNQDASRFATALGLIRGGIPNAPALTREVVRLYFAVCEDLPIEAIEAGAIAWLRRPTAFFPSAGEFRAVCMGRTNNQAQVEWMAVLKEVRRVGYMGTPKLDAAARETIDGLWGTWSHLCRTLPGEGPELIGWGKRFESSYNALAERREHPTYLGRAEAKSALSSLLRQVAERRDEVLQ
jgi:hypothetical protein